MKLHLLLLLICIFSNSFLKAQTINGIPIEEIKVEYVEVIATQRLRSNDLGVRINFGQNSGFTSGENLTIKDKDGILIELKTMIDALNFLAEIRYEYLNGYLIEGSGGQHVYRTIMKKKK